RARRLLPRTARPQARARKRDSGRRYAGGRDHRHRRNRPGSRQGLRARRRDPGGERQTGRGAARCRERRAQRTRRRQASAADAAEGGGGHAVRRRPNRVNTMTAQLSRKDVIAMLGELDDVAVADIIATGATPEELAQAHAWLTNDEALINAGKPLPTGRVGRLDEIVVAKEAEEEETAAR